jgi:hypothetical protein
MNPLESPVFDFTEELLTGWRFTEQQRLASLCDHRPTVRRPNAAASSGSTDARDALDQRRDRKISRFRQMPIPFGRTLRGD